ncbi:MAG: DUF1579 family protein [Bacteroidota bacterium]
MAKNKTSSTKPGSQVRKLNFLIGNWHTKGEILQGAPKSSKEIRGMDTYEWIAGGFFILHRVDVFMANERTEVIEIIGYDKSRKSYFMKSFDNRGEATTMYAVLEKPGVLKLGDQKMRSKLTVDKSGNAMTAKWELSENGASWTPWMDMQFRK